MGKERAEAEREMRYDFNMDINNILYILIEFFDAYEKAHDDDKSECLHYLMEDLYSKKDDIEKYFSITTNNII